MRLERQPRGIATVTRMVRGGGGFFLIWVLPEVSGSGSQAMAFGPVVSNVGVGAADADSRHVSASALGSPAQERDAY